MFKNFPKKRPSLPSEIKAVYSTHYKSNREGTTFASSLAQKAESWLHKKVAADVAALDHSSKKTLELGAGTLNQLQYEPESLCYDIVEPFKELYSDSEYIDRVSNIYSDVSEVPSANRYDRVTSVATLEHICNLPEVVARIGLLLESGGVFRSAIPSEGTLLWGISWRLTTGLEFKFSHGLDYGLLMKHEHVNTAKEISEILAYFFDIKTVKVFGINKSISLYQFYECHSPDARRCEKYISSLS